MNLKDVAAISGKPGLYKILKPTKTGVILETIAKDKKKTVINASQRISVLKEISIYVEGEAEESVALENVFASIKEKHGDKVDVKVSDVEALISFLESVLPNYDKARVYNSDIKKVVNWYNTLAEFYPESLVVKEEGNAEESAESQESTEEKA